MGKGGGVCRATKLSNILFTRVEADTGGIKILVFIDSPRSSKLLELELFSYDLVL